jgi:RimJ/RimL family protein N-acetyltransferase
MPVLETTRLTLRPFREKDVDLLAELMANTNFMRFSLGVFSGEQTTAFLEKLMDWERRGLPSQFAVIHRASNRLIGYCGFFHQQVDGTDEIEIGYRLHPDYWGRGLATEAVQAVRDHAFADLKLPRVISLIHPDNLPSRLLPKKESSRSKRCLRFPTQVASRAGGWRVPVNNRGRARCLRLRLLHWDVLRMVLKLGASLTERFAELRSVYAAKVLPHVGHNLCADRVRLSVSCRTAWLGRLFAIALGRSVEF